MSKKNPAAVALPVLLSLALVAPSCRYQPKPRPADALPKMVCAYCGLVTRDGPEPTSHGVCPSCYAKAIKELDEDDPPVRTDFIP